MPVVLWPLLFGNFVIGTGVMTVPGTLNEISSDLSISIGAAGLLISAGARADVRRGPLVRRAGGRLGPAPPAGAVHAVVRPVAPGLRPGPGLQLAAALARAGPHFAGDLHAAGGGVRGLLVPAQQRGRAITFVFLGWSVASVLGMPLAALVDGTFGRRSAFVVVAC
jgi:predicted MFS family arabinose efflux permease